MNGAFLKKSSLVFGWLMALVACQPKTQVQEYESFPESRRLENYSGINAISSHRASDYKLHDSLLFILEYQSEFPMFRAHSLNDFRQLATFGKKGRGPMEITSGFTFSINPSGTYLWTVDNTKRQLFGFSLDSVLFQGKQLPDKKVDFPEGMLRFIYVIDMHMPSDSVFAFTVSSHKELATLMNTHGELLGHLGQLPIPRYNTDPDLGFAILNRHYNLFLDSLMITSYRYFDRVTAYNYQNELQWSIVGPLHIQPERKYDGNYFKTYDHTLKAYGHPHFYQGHVYIPFSGLGMFNSQGYDIRQNYFNEIHVFDLHGNPKLKLILDNEISYFCFDSKRNRMIALSAMGDFILYRLQDMQITHD